jgi:VWFA-related protein
MFRKFFVFGFAAICFFAMLNPLFSQLEESVNVDVIEVWVKVTDKTNQPIPDLGPKDFQIYIDGKKMENRCFDKTFETTQPTDGTDNQGNNGSNIKRRFIFFFDLLNSSARDVDYLKAKITDFLNTSFRETDEGMVFVLVPTVRLGVVQQMTSNKEALIDVISRMHGNPSLASRIRNNEKELLTLLYGFNVPAAAPTIERREQPDTIRQARSVARSFAAQEENLSRFTMNSFLSIASYLQANRYDGRLVMIYFSGGFPLHPGQNYFQIVERAMEESNEFGSNELGFREHPEYHFDTEVRNAIGLLNRLNVTIYSVDCAGLVENDRGVERDSFVLQKGGDNVPLEKELQDSLALVARETGGISFVNSQNYQKGLSEIAADLGQQYWLCSTAPPPGKPGSYHKIEIKVARNDVNVRHRQGYTE